MHTDPGEKMIARQLRALGEEPARAPYDWAEFQRRRHAGARTPRMLRRTLAGLALASAAAVLLGIAIAGLSHHRASVSAPLAAFEPLHGNDGAGRDAIPRTRAQERARTVEGWLASLPRDPAVIRVGEHAAVSSLQDQIAALDDLMSSERVAGVQPAKMGALERQRAQLVSSLAQLRYAEMLASATP